jgi:hypothetical protein
MREDGNGKLDREERKSEEREGVRALSAGGATD